MFQYNTKLRSQEILTFMSVPVNVAAYDYMPSQLLNADPLYRFLSRFHWSSVTGSVNPRYIDKSEAHLRTYHRNVYLGGLSVIVDVLRRKHRESLHDNYPSWNRRRTLTVSGALRSVVKFTIAGWMQPSWSLPVGLSDDTDVSPRGSSVPVVAGGSQRYLYFDDFVYFAKRMQKYDGQVFRVNESLGRSSQCIISDLMVSETRVSYHLTAVAATMYPSARKQSNNGIQVVIERKQPKGSLPFTSVSFFGLSQTKGFNGTSTFTLSYPETFIQYDHQDLSADATVLANEIEYIRKGAYGLSIDAMRGALYHTQGKALGGIMIDLDKNFENAVEASSFFPLITDLLLNPDVRKVLNRSGSLGGQIKSLSRIISGGILAWNFAIKPTIEALDSLINPFVLPTKSEASLVYERTSITALPAGLQSLLKTMLLIPYKQTDVDWVKCTFRSEAWTTPSYENFVQTLVNENIILRGGFLPTPSGAWASSPGSFVIDWFLPITRLLDDHQSYFLSFTLPFRIGHSFKIEAALKDGRYLTIFSRSDESNLPIDPPGDSWLEAPGLPPISIALGISALLGFL
jgi:hypothetical protein